MKDQILDAQEKEPKKPDHRSTHLFIECLFWVIIFLGFLSPQYFGFTIPGVAFIGLLLFYLISPAFRYFKKQISTIKMMLLYGQTLSFLALFFLGIFKFESWEFPLPDIFFLIIIILVSLFLAIIPQLEIKKEDASNKVKLLVGFLGLGILTSFLGLYLVLESYPFGRELLIISGIINSINLISMGILLINKWKDYAYLSYYLPRLMVASWFGLNMSIVQFL